MAVNRKVMQRNEVHDDNFAGAGVGSVLAFAEEMPAVLQVATEKITFSHIDCTLRELRSGLADAADDLQTGGGSAYVDISFIAAPQLETATQACAVRSAVAKAFNAHGSTIVAGLEAEAKIVKIAFNDLCSHFMEEPTAQMNDPSLSALEPPSSIFTIIKIFAEQVNECKVSLIKRKATKRHDRTGEKQPTQLGSSRRKNEQPALQSSATMPAGRPGPAESGSLAVGYITDSKGTLRAEQFKTPTKTTVEIGLPGPLQILEPDDETILMGYYQHHEPGFATPEKIQNIIRAYRRKEKPGAPAGSWREQMYGAFVKKRGTDPRDHWRHLSPRRVAVAKSKVQKRRPGTGDLLQQAAEACAAVARQKRVAGGLPVLDSPAHLKPTDSSTSFASSPRLSSMDVSPAGRAASRLTAAENVHHNCFRRDAEQEATASATFSLANLHSQIDILYDKHCADGKGSMDRAGLQAALVACQITLDDLEINALLPTSCGNHMSRSSFAALLCDFVEAGLISKDAFYGAINAVNRNVGMDDDCASGFSVNEQKQTHASGLVDRLGRVRRKVKLPTRRRKMNRRSGAGDHVSTGPSLEDEEGRLDKSLSEEESVTCWEA